jgi:hypothetical protein
VNHLSLSLTQEVGDRSPLGTKRINPSQARPHCGHQKVESIAAERAGINGVGA